jgi:hypothetical protein
MYALLNRKIFLPVRVEQTQWIVDHIGVLIQLLWIKEMAK